MWLIFIYKIVLSEIGILISFEPQKNVIQDKKFWSIKGSRIFFYVTTKKRKTFG